MVALGLIGVAFLTGRRRVVRPAVIVFAVLCLADWVLIEDFGFFGGLGTDPNSMLPFTLLAVGGYLALTSEPAAATEPVTTEPVTTEPPPRRATLPAAAGWRERFRPAALRRSVGTASIQSVAAVGALGLIILGAAPMAAAQASSTADPILAEAIAGSTAPLNFPAKGFQLTDQHGRTVSLASLHGKVVLLTFLDPVCTSDCPLIAQEFRAAGQLLGASARHVELVAVVANPVYHQIAYTQAFDRQERLDPGT